MGHAWCRSARRAATSGCGPSGSAPTRTSRCSCCTVVPGRPTSSTSASTPGSPAPGIEYYYYDQLGSFRSDQPDDPSLWDLARFVDEVEQVRLALGLDASNFVLLGQSWGGLLAMEYAVHHQEHLKGLVISNMMASARLYNDYATDVLMPTMDQAVLAEIKPFEAEGRTDDPRYEQLLMEHHYVAARLPAPARRVAGPAPAGAGAHQPGDLRAHAGAERARSQRHARGLGPVRRPGRHRRTDPRHRRDPRHDGPRAHALDVRAAAAGHATCTAPTAATARSSTTPSTTSPG